MWRILPQVFAIQKPSWSVKYGFIAWILMIYTCRSTSGFDPRRRLSFPSDEYTVGWICALPIEVHAATAMLDEIHQPPPRDKSDPIMYTLGHIGEHKVVIGCLNHRNNFGNPTATLATLMTEKFPSIRIVLSVGIGSGIPTDQVDIKVGDVVIGQPNGMSSGIVQFSLGEGDHGEAKQTGHLNTPPTILSDAIKQAQLLYNNGFNRYPEYLTSLEEKAFLFERQRIAQKDQMLLHGSRERLERLGGGKHQDLAERLEGRPPRGSHLPFKVHFGKIASAYLPIRDAQLRDDINNALGSDILCLESEAAGLTGNFPGLIIRGIHNYAEPDISHDLWARHAAATATAYTKELLSFISASRLARLPPIKASSIALLSEKNNFLQARSKLDVLSDHLKAKREGSHVAIYGPDASGKNVIAMEFYYQALSQHPLVFWVSASDLHHFETAYRKIAVQLKLISSDDDKPDVLPLVKEALNDPNVKPWLIIIDNAEALADLVNNQMADLPHSSFLGFIPNNAQGMVLFITKTRKAAESLAGEQLVPLEKMGLADIYFLTLDLSKRPYLHDTAMSEALMEDLRYFPPSIVWKAFSQWKKSSSKANTSTTNSQLFSEIDRSQIGSLGKWSGVDIPYEDLLSPVPVTTFIQFFSSMQDDDQFMKLVFILACIAPTRIQLSGLLPNVSSSELERLSLKLKSHNYLIEERQPGLYSTNRLTRLRIRNWMIATDSLTSWSEIASLGLIQILRNGTEEAEACSLFLPHGLRLISEAEFSKSLFAIDLLAGIALCQMRFEDCDTAEENWNLVLYRRKTTLGPVHSETLESMFYLGETISNQCRYDEAEQLHRQALQMTQMTSQHRLTQEIIILSQLILALIKQHKADEVDQMYGQMCSTLELAMGSHLESHNCVKNFAKLLARHCKYSEAEQMYRQALEIWQTLYSEENLTIMDMRRNLAIMLKMQKKYGEAEGILRQLLKQTQFEYGVLHPAATLVMTDWLYLLKEQVDQTDQVPDL